MTIIDTIRTDIENVFEKHRPEIDKVLVDGEQAATNPVIQQIGALAHVPASALNLFAAFLAKLDDEFAKVGSAPVAPTPAPPAVPASLPPLPGTQTVSGPGSPVAGG